MVKQRQVTLVADYYGEMKRRLISDNKNDRIRSNEQFCPVFNRATKFSLENSRLFNVSVIRA